MPCEHSPDGSIALQNHQLSGILLLLVTAVYPHFYVVGCSRVPVQTLSVNDTRTAKHNLLFFI